MMGNTAPNRAVQFGGCLKATMEARNDGSLLMRSAETLAPYPQRLSDCLREHAAATPSRAFVARREAGTGAWVSISYPQMDGSRTMARMASHHCGSSSRPPAIASCTMD